MISNYQYFAMLKMWAKAVQSLKPVAVPSPIIFDSSLWYKIEDFFYFFEKYCLATFGNDTVSWLQIFSDLAIVSTFGISRSLEYGNVKTRLIEEFNVRNFGDDDYARYLDTVS